MNDTKDTSSLSDSLKNTISEFKPEKQVDDEITSVVHEINLKIHDLNKICKKIQLNHPYISKDITDVLQSFSICYVIQVKLFCNCEKICRNQLKKKINTFDANCKYYKFTDFKSNDPKYCQLFLEKFKPSNYKFYNKIFNVKKYKGDLITENGFKHVLLDFCYGKLDIGAVECFATNLYFECKNQNNCFSHIFNLSNLYCNRKKFRKIKKSLENIFKNDYNFHLIENVLSTKLKTIKHNKKMNDLYFYFPNITLMKNKLYNSNFQENDMAQINYDENKKYLIEPTSTYSFENDSKNLSNYKIINLDNNTENIIDSASMYGTLSKNNDLSINHSFVKKFNIGIYDQPTILNKQNLTDFLIDFDPNYKNGSNIMQVSIVSFLGIILFMVLFFMKRFLSIKF